MQASETVRDLRSKDLPSDIYLPLVDSLYKDGRTLFVGSLCVVASVLTTYWNSGDPFLLLCALAISLVAGARGLLMRAYGRVRSEIKTNEQGRKWEQRYVIGAAASVGLLGMWCFAAFANTNDPFAHLVSFSITIAYLIGVFGRNFGNSRSVVVQIVCAWVPMAAALLLYGNFYYWAFAGLLIPFFVAVKFIAERLRRTLLEAVIATRDVSLLATRFDTALNNMPHGLCMFDSGQHAVVANARVTELLGLPEKLELRGMSVRQLIEYCVDSGTFSAKDVDAITRDLDDRLRGNRAEDFTITTRDNRTLEFTFQPMDNGGTVFLIEDVTDRTIAEAKINHMARYDALTGLPNRVILRNRIEKALVENGPNDMFAVHFVDLDQFKQVNDTLGHTSGDMLLKAVAERLRPLIRETDIIARFGGDEFVIMQQPIRSASEASGLARRVLAALQGTYEISGHEVVINASIGIALAPKDGSDVDQLMRNADMALYRAKSDNRGTWRFFKPEMEVSAQARRNLELDLRYALENDAFEVYYQPIFDLRTKRIVTCEALLRWPHPERGMISPAEFIPVAEEMGLIVEIGKQVLRKACIECNAWPDDIRVAVNLSPIQFSRANVPFMIRDVLAATGLPANRLEIEVTETTILQDTSRTRDSLRQLDDLGVRISLDDFGTGYSGLSYLHSFPLHKIKIDQSFLRGLEVDDRRLTLLRGIARLSAELGLRVAVEGVETYEQLELISSEDSVDEVQGYLFSMALPGAAIRELLQAFPTSRFEAVA